MIHHIEIKDNDPDAKNLLLYLHNLAKTNNYIDFLTEQKIEELEDELLVKKMKKVTKGEVLNVTEKKNFINQLKKVAAK